MARLFADENFPAPVIENLLQMGHDVRTMADIGKAGQAVSDETVLSQSSEDGRAVITLNRRHFVRLHGEHPGHAGIIVYSFDPDFERQAQRIHDAIRAAGTLSGQLLRVNRPQR